IALPLSRLHRSAPLSGLSAATFSAPATRSPPSIQARSPVPRSAASRAGRFHSTRPVAPLTRSSQRSPLDGGSSTTSHRSSSSEPAEANNTSPGKSRGGGGLGAAGAGVASAGSGRGLGRESELDQLHTATPTVNAASMPMNGNNQPYCSATG